MSCGKLTKRAKKTHVRKVHKAKNGKKSSASKKLEALRRAEQISEILETGNIQSQALLSGAGDTKPVDELHSEELLGQKISAFELSDKTIVPRVSKSRRKKNVKKRRRR